MPTNLDLINQSQTNYHEQKFIIGQNRIDLFSGIKCILPEDTFSIKLSRLESTVSLESVQNMLTQLKIEYFELQLVRLDSETFKSFSFRAPRYQEDKIFDASIWPYGLKVEKYFD
jgi:hypothetical protein